MHKRLQTSMTLCTYTQPFANKHAAVQTCRSRLQINTGLCTHTQARASKHVAVRIYTVGCK